MADDAGASEDVQKFSIGYRRKKFENGVYGVKLEGWSVLDIDAQTPSGLKELLEANDAMSVYEEFVNEIESLEKKVFGIGGYKTEELDALEKTYTLKFQEKGIKLFFCSKVMYYDGGYKTYKWLEFVDPNVAPTYTPREKHDPNRICSIM